MQCLTLTLQTFDILSLTYSVILYLRDANEYICMDRKLIATGIIILAGLRLENGMQSTFS